jgi:lipopolysaccharide export system permease protein
MRVLRRHIATTVLLAILLVLVVIVMLNLLGLIIEQVGDIYGEYDFSQVMLYVAWRAPGYIVNNIGFAALIGCLIGLGVLANGNELMVMRASGVSILQITRLVMYPVLLVIVIGMGLAEVAPYTERVAEGNRDIALTAVFKEKLTAHKKAISKKKLNKNIKEKIKKGAARLRLAETSIYGKAVWNREGNEFIRFATVLPDGRIFGITRFGFNDDQTLAWIQSSQEGSYQDAGWLLEDVRTTYLDKTHPDKILSRDTRETLHWKTQLTPEMLIFVSTDPESLTFRELERYGNFLKEQQRDSRAYELEWWKKVIKPLEIFSLVVLAISFVFGPLRQVTMGQRVFTGVMVGVIFQTLQNMFSTSSLVFGFSPFVAVMLPIAVCASLGFVMILRAR